MLMPPAPKGNAVNVRSSPFKILANVEIADKSSGVVLLTVLVLEGIRFLLKMVSAIIYIY